MIPRRSFLVGAVASAVARADGGVVTAPSIEERSLRALRDALDRREVTARQLLASALERIARLDSGGPQLKSVIELNPDAEKIAAACDAAPAPLGPLHGIPVMIKETLDTADQMKTTAGSRILEGAPQPVRDAFAVERLRQAGAVIVGKTNPSEWANLRGAGSTSGWSARGGLTKNPYVTTRNASGSSSGSAVAVAASLCTISLGTETDGSIVSPASVCGVVGFKPSVGLVSRGGVIPISSSQDTVGPFGRSVEDVALTLDVIAGADPRDAATQLAPASVRTTKFSEGLQNATLAGKRLGVVRAMVNANWNVREVATDVLARIAAAGATLVDVELSAAPYGDDELLILRAEMKAGLEAYLKARGGPLQTLQDLIAANRARASEELVFYGQEHFEAAAAMGPLTSAPYRAAKAHCAKLRTELHGVLAKHKLDGIVAPTGTVAWLTDFANGDQYTFGFSSPAAIAGTPHLTVPMGFVGELPVSLSVIGGLWKDAEVLRLGAAVERLLQVRKAPRYFTR